MNLWQKHGVSLLDTDSAPYRLLFGEQILTPILNSRVAAWRDNSGNPFPERDLTPHRVGVAALPRGNTGVIHCFPTTWARYMLMSKNDVWEMLPVEERFHVLTVNCVIKTGDARFILASRSKGLSHFGGMLHVSAAGYVDLHAATESRTPLVQCFIELQEELNILPCDTLFIKQLGIAVRLPPDNAGIEVCYYTEVSMTAWEVIERAKTARDSWEGKISAFSEIEVRRMLETEKFLPTGAATLMILFGI